eukprot:ctg_2259.g660
MSSSRNSVTRISQSGEYLWGKEYDQSVAERVRQAYGEWPEAPSATSVHSRRWTEDDAAARGGIGWVVGGAAGGAAAGDGLAVVLRVYRRALRDGGGVGARAGVAGASAVVGVACLVAAGGRAGCSGGRRRVVADIATDAATAGTVVATAGHAGGDGALRARCGTACAATAGGGAGGAGGPASRGARAVALYAVVQGARRECTLATAFGLLPTGRASAARAGRRRSAGHRARGVRSAGPAFRRAGGAAAPAGGHARRVAADETATGGDTAADDRASGDPAAARTGRRRCQCPPPGGVAIAPRPSRASGARATTLGRIHGEYGGGRSGTATSERGTGPHCSLPGDLRAQAVAFWQGRIVAPLASVYREVFLSSYKTSMSPDSVHAEREALQRMVTDFTRETYRNASAEERRAAESQAARGDLAPVMQVYERQLRNPVVNMLAGDVIRALLIQVQKLKVDVEEEMVVVDALVRANELNLQVAAAVPGVLMVAVATTAAVRAGTRWWRSVRSTEVDRFGSGGAWWSMGMSARHTAAERARWLLRDVERVLTGGVESAEAVSRDETVSEMQEETGGAGVDEAAAAANGGDAAVRSDALLLPPPTIHRYENTGRVLLTLSELEELARTHAAQLHLRTAAQLDALLREDLADLRTASLSAAQKLRTIERIRWTYACFRAE